METVRHTIAVHMVHLKLSFAEGEGRVSPHIPCDGVTGKLRGYDLKAFEGCVRSSWRRVKLACMSDERMLRHGGHHHVR